MPEKFKGILGFALRLSVSGGLLFLVLWKVNLGRVLGELRGANPWLLAVACGLVLMGYLASAARWWVLLRAHVPDASLREVVEAILAGLFVGNLLPSGAGVDVVRGGFLMAKGRPGSAGFASIFVDRLVGMLVSASVATLGLWGKPQLRSLGPLAFAGIALVGAAFFSRRLGKKAEGLLIKLRFWSIGPRAARFLEAVRLYRSKPRRLAWAALFSVALQASLASAVLVASAALGQSVPPYLHYLYVPAVNLLTMIPVTIAGIGLREGGFVFFYSGVLEPGQAVALSLTYYLASVAPTLLGALPLLGTKRSLQGSNLR